MEGEIDPRLRGDVLAQHAQYPALPPSSHGIMNPLRPALDPMHPSTTANPTRSATHQASDPSPLQAQAPTPGQAQAQAPPYYDLASIDPSNASEQTVDAATAGHDPKRPRACEACRGLKVRCQPDEDNFDGPCKRCAKAGRNCVVTVPSRKRQKKTDSRVAELEKKIDALTASLQARRSEGRDDPESEGEAYNMAEDQRGYKTGMADAPRTDRESVKRPAANGQDQSAYRDKSRSSITSASESPVTYRSSLSQISGVKRRHSDNEGIAQTYGTASSSTGVNSPATRPSPKDGPPSIYSFLMPKNSKALPPPTPEPSTVSLSFNPHHDYTDVIDRGLLSSETATIIFDKYAKQMSQHMPIVIFPEATTAAEVRKARPTLFLAILSVGSGAFYPDLQRLLTREIMRIFADRIICSGEKNLELVQALLVTVMWYWPPEHFEELNFYQLSNMAMTMAVDLGLYRKPLSRNQALAQPAGTWRDKRRGACLPDSSTVEARRTWISCYFLCAVTSISLRRPTLLRWTAYTEDCVRFLETSPDAVPTDKVLCAWVKAQHIGEEISLQFAMDDPDASLRLTDANVQYALKAFERQHKDWKASLPSDVAPVALSICGHSIDLYMHEISLHVNHNIDDFKPPFTEATLKGGSEYSEVLTSAHINALSICVRSIHGVFEDFMSFDVDVVRSLPTFYFVRCMYTMVVLIKMHFAVINPKSELGKIFSKEDLKAEAYADRIVSFFKLAADGDLSRPAKKFLMILYMIKKWFYQQIGDDCRPLEQSQNPSIQRPPSSFGRVSANGDPGIYSGASRQRSEGVTEYSSANTPLQLLSEVAMGSNANPRPDGSNLQNTASTNAGSSFPDWSAVPANGSGPAPGAGYSLPSVGPNMGDGNNYGGMDTGFEKINGDNLDPTMQFSLGEGDLGFGSIFMDNSFMSSILDGTPNLFENWT